MSEVTGPIYTGAGIPLKGFDQLIEVAANASTLQQRRGQQLEKARLGQQNRIQKMMDDVYEETGADLAPGLRPFWVEHVTMVDEQIQNMQLVNGTPITSIAQGNELLRQANAFYDELYGYNHVEGKYVADDEVELIEGLIRDPKKQKSFLQNVPVDQTYNFTNAETANSQLADMTNYANYGFLGVTADQITDGSYMAGGYQNHGEIDYSGPTPTLVLKTPLGITDTNSSSGFAQTGARLGGLSIYGANHEQLFNVQRFAVNRQADDLFNLGQEFLQPLVKEDRIGLGWDRTKAQQLVTGLVNNTQEAGERIRYSILSQNKIENPNFLSEQERRAFLYNNPLLAFETDDAGKTTATATEIEELKSKFNTLKGNNDYISQLVNGSNFDRNVRQDATAEERNVALDNTLSSMTTINPNDIFSIDDVSSLINNGSLFLNPGEADAFNGAYARLLIQNAATLGGDVQPGMGLGDILMVGGPSYAMVGTQPDSDAGVTRSFIEQFEGDSSNLPQTVGNFPVNMKGSSQYAFSPQTGVEGYIDNVFFTRGSDGSMRIGVALNKSGVTGYGVSSSGKPITPLEGNVQFQIGDPFFSVGLDADGANFLNDLGTIDSNSQLINQQYNTGTPELVFYFDPTNSADMNKLSTLGSKLDEFYERKGESFPNAVNDNLGYTLNAMFAKIQ
jgi:hypothetical protein